MIALLRFVFIVLVLLSLFFGSSRHAILEQGRCFT